MNVIQTISTVIGLLATAGITVQTVMFRRANKRIKDAEAKTAEVNADTASTNNAILATNEWKAIAEDIKADNAAKDTKIDQLYADLGTWRDKLFEEQKAHHETRIELKDAQMQLAEEKWHRCEVNGCTKRVPPRSRTEKTTDNG